MAEIYLYADETGNLDYESSGKEGGTPYFGFGTAVFPRGRHGKGVFDGLRLRARLERQGLSLPRGFHAVNDSRGTRREMFEEIKSQAPRFDMTFLLKENAYPGVRARGQMYLYKMAWFLHFKEIARQVSNRGDRLYVIVGTFGTKTRQSLARESLRDVCNQVDREVVLCVWEAATSWGLQVADYGLWAAQRDLVRGRCGHYVESIEPTTASFFLPWEE